MSKFLLKITKLQVLRHGCDMRKIKWEFFLLKRMMTTAMIHLSTEEKRRLTTKSWSIAKCPIQPGNVECGYYVMSFMKHFMEDPTKPTKTKMMELANKKAYTTAELTEIRTDLINHIMSLVT